MGRRITRKAPEFSSGHGEVRSGEPSDQEHSAALLQIQRMAGNRAALAASDRLGNASGTSLSDALSALRPQAEADSRPALDPVAEARADAASADVARKELSITDGGPIPTEVRAQLEPQLGSLSDIRLHSGSEARRQADDMGARAFTKGRDIFLGAGERDANLIAHEAAHAAHDSTGVGHDGAQLVHAKLKGTFGALVEKGGPVSPNTGKASKARKLLAPKNWDKILENVAKYEEIEDVLTKGGSPSDKALAKTAPKMLAVLGSVEKACLDWQKANGQDEAERIKETSHKKNVETGQDTPDDLRSKSERRQAVALLLPRIRVEKDALKSGKWKDQLGLNDSNAKSVQKGADQGQVSEVDKVVFGTPQGGEYKAFFKEDKGFSSKMAGQDVTSGIRQADPMWGARSVAMYKLDQLLGAGVTAKTDFATLEGKFGTAQEMATGTKASQVNFVANDTLKSENPGTVSLEDETLQRCLNRLQLLDAIAGQLDRHAGNYFVQVGPGGEVTGVTGIDLDMSFGQDVKDPTKKVQAALSWKGIPPRIDEQFGEAILKVSSADIKAALKGLLPDAEINSTISRFESVQKAVRDAKQSNTLVKNWGKDIAQEDKVQGEVSGSQERFYDPKTYQGVLMGKTSSVYDQVFNMVGFLFDGIGFDGSSVNMNLWYRRMEEFADSASKNIFKNHLMNVAANHLQIAARKGLFPSQQVASVFSALINEMLGDERWWTKVIIDFQEGGDSKDLIDAQAQKCLGTAIAKGKKGGVKV